MNTHTIPAGTYEGYLWPSDQPRPRVLLGESITALTLTDGENPFTVEGVLWAPATSTSIAIRYIDGQYHIYNKVVTAEERAAEDNVVTYLPHRLDGVAALRFLRRWKAEKDELCENMEVLRLQDTVFIGFEKQEEDKQ